MAQISVLLLLIVSTGFCYSVNLPVWPKSYMTQGLLKLPYAEIQEPFTAYFDGVKMRSRIDYYGNMVYTKQIGAQGNKSFGQSYKVAYKTTEMKYNVKTCFLLNGTKDAPVEVQVILPNVEGFKYIGAGDDKNSDMFQKVEKLGNKKNTYTLWVTKGTQVPVKYEMMGYDTLLGSHYDKYYLEYTHFTKGNITDAAFNLPTGVKTCEAFGPGDSEHRITMNPMQEYMHNDDRHIDEMFDMFKKTHKKQYKNGMQHAERKHVFRNNVRFVHSKNRAGLGYSLAVNHLTDLTDQEMKSMRGFRRSNKPNNALPFNVKDFKKNDVPKSLDWRLFGAVTPVKDQAVCGSCWSFGTSGHIEGAYFFKTGELVRLSQQELMDCSWGEGNNACEGGEDFQAYEWIKKHGLATEGEYGSYLAQDSKCKSQNVTGRAFVDSYVNITSGDVQALKIAMANRGPISVAIDAAHKEMSFYSNGVYYNPKCGNTTDELDHAVLAVGYGYMNGEAYWLVKNSWSTYWGNDGYILMSSKDNNCGVATAATFVYLTK